MKHHPTLLIDGDVIAYKAAAAVERTFSWDGDNHTTVGSLEEAKVIVEDALASLLKGFKTKHYIVTLSDAVNWRHSIYGLYKANRKDKPRPSCLGAVKDYLDSTHPTYQRPTLEADDIMGILSTHPGIVKKQYGFEGERIIVSIDKDMRCLPGVFYDLGSKELIEISAPEADRFHMYQTLIGDTSDGYPGCPGIGPVRAGRILEQGASYAEWWPLIVTAYTKAGQTEADALTMARIARICRAQDYNYKTKEVIPWTPISTNTSK